MPENTGKQNNFWHTCVPSNNSIDNPNSTLFSELITEAHLGSLRLLSAGKCWKNTYFLKPQYHLSDQTLGS